MRITSFILLSYKSFYATDTILLTEGFNVVIGANNTGKTAIIQALCIHSVNVPHRSRHYVPYTDAPVIPTSVSLSFAMSYDDFIDTLIANSLRDFHVPVTPSPGTTIVDHHQQIRAHFSSLHTITLDVVFQAGTLSSAALANITAGNAALYGRLDEQTRNIDDSDGYGADGWALPKRNIGSTLGALWQTVRQSSGPMQRGTR